MVWRRFSTKRLVRTGLIAAIAFAGWFFLGSSLAHAHDLTAEDVTATVSPVGLAVTEPVTNVKVSTPVAAVVTNVKSAAGTSAGSVPQVIPTASVIVRTAAATATRVPDESRAAVSSPVTTSVPTTTHAVRKLGLATSPVSSIAKDVGQAATSTVTATTSGAAAAAGSTRPVVQAVVGQVSSSIGAVTAANLNPVGGMLLPVVSTSATSVNAPVGSAGALLGNAGALLGNAGYIGPSSLFGPVAHCAQPTALVLDGVVATSAAARPPFGTLGAAALGSLGSAVPLGTLGSAVPGLPAFPNLPALPFGCALGALSIGSSPDGGRGGLAAALAVALLAVLATSRVPLSRSQDVLRPLGTRPDFSPD
ncbi:MAG: hypothetical protein ACR2MP_20310 [Streptosporangiaceae bacterium]